MKLVIRGECTDPSLDHGMRRQLARAFSRFHTWIHRVVLQWRGEDGAAPNSTVYRCELSLQFRNGESGKVSEIGYDLPEALHRATSQAVRLSEHWWSISHQPPSSHLPPGR